MRFYKSFGNRRQETCLWLLAMLSLAASWGCATTALLEGEPDSDPNFYSQPVESDAVYALGKPDDKMAQAMGQPYTLVFLGERHSYWLTAGGDELLRIAERLDGRRIDLSEDGGKPEARLYRQDQRVWGNLLLAYRSDDSSERLTLNQLGFAAASGNGGVYHKAIAVAGTVYGPLKLSGEQTAQLQMRRTVQFFRPPDSSPPPKFDTATKVALLPFALAFDAASGAAVVAGGLLLLPLVVVDE